MPLSASSVPPESVDFVFDRFAKELSRAFPHDSLDQLKDSVIHGQRFAWLFHDDDLVACAVLSIRQYPGTKCLVVDAIAGKDMDRWIGRLEELLREYRDLIGAGAIRALCRDGAVKKLGDRWKRKSTLMELK